MKSRNLGKLVLAAALAASGCAVPENGKTQISKSAEASGQHDVCSKDNLPDGWVIVAESHSPSECPAADPFSTDETTTYTIKKAGRFETVCDGSPIPGGYVKKTAVKTTACPIPAFAGLSFTNGFEIEQL